MELETEATADNKTLRIFISSPGDVKAERDKARQVIDQLQKWYGPAVNLVPVLWEEMPLEIDASFQDGIDVILSDDKGIDIAVFILWSRLGTPVTIGEWTYNSGTEREFDLMLHALQASGGERPDVLFYRRRDDDAFAAKLSDPDNLDQTENLIAQRKLAKNFFQEHFWDENGQNIRAYHSFHQTVEFAGRLKVHLQGLIDRRLEESGLSREARWTDAPYRGLEVFHQEHADIFFGREQEIVELESRLRDRENEEQPCAFVAVVGASGSGKSSLVRAGLRANLTRFNLDESISEWRSFVMIPGQAEGNPVRYLLECLTQPGALPELAQGGLSLDELAENLAGSLTTTINLTIKPLMKGATEKASPKLLVIVDQFEEVFTDKRISGEDRDFFLLTLEALAQSGICWVVATMRSDFFPVAQKSEIFLRLKGETGHFDLLAPGPEALRRIITEPARMAGIRFEKRAPELGGQSVVGRILEDAREQPDMLPLLSDLLLELYQLRSEDNVITFAAYESLGDEDKTGLEGALSKRAEKEFAKLTGEQRATCPEILHALVTVEADADVRRRADLNALRDTPQKAALVDAFIEARLLTADGSTVSIAHEALLRKWDRIANWVRDNRQHLRIRSRVEQSMRRWANRDNHDSLLLPEGLALEEGVGLLRNADHLLAGAEYDELREYIKRSESAQLRRVQKIRTRRQRVIFSLSCLSILAVCTAVIAWKMAHMASDKEEEANQLVKEASGSAWAASKKAFDDHQNLGVGFARLAEAIKLNDNLPFDARNPIINNDAVLRLLQNTAKGRLLSSTAHNDLITDVEFTANGDSVVSASEKLLKVWDPKTGESKCLPFPLYKGVYDFNAAHSQLAVGQGNLLRVYKVPARNEEIVFSHPKQVDLVRFSNDGRLILTATSENVVRLWSMKNNKEPLIEISHARDVTHFAFSNTNKFFLTVTFYEGIRHEANGTNSSLLQVWETSTGKSQDKEIIVENGRIRAACFLPRGESRLCIIEESEDERGVVGQFGTHVKIWNLVEGKTEGDPIPHEPFYTGKAEIEISRMLNQILVPGPRKKAAVWDLYDGGERTRKMRHSSRLNRARFSQDEQLISTACWDGVASIWDRSGNFFTNLTHQDRVYDAVFSPDPTMVVTTSRDSLCRVWEIGATPRSLRIMGVRSISPSGRQVAISLKEQNLIIVRESTTGEIVAPAILTKHPSRTVSFSHDERYLATAGLHSAEIWEIKTGRRLGGVREYADGVINHLIFSHDGRFIGIVRSANHKIKLRNGGYAMGIAIHVDVWGFHSQKKIGDTISYFSEIGSLGGGSGYSSESFISARSRFRVQFSPDSNWLMIGSNSDTWAYVWRVMAPTGNRPNPIKVIGSEGGCFSGDSSKCLGFGSNGPRRCASVFSFLQNTHITEGFDHEKTINDANFSHNGMLVVTCGDDNCARVWDSSTGKLVSGPFLHKREVNTAVFSPDDEAILTTSLDGSARIWSVVTGDEIGKPMTHEKAPRWGRFSSDGKWIFTFDGDSLRIWASRNCDSVGGRMVHSEYVHSAKISPDGNWVFAFCSESVQVWPFFGDEIHSLNPRILESVGGFRVSEDGDIVSAWSEVENHRKQSTILGNNIPDIRLRRVLEWSLSSHGERNVFPNSAISNSDFVRRLLEFSLEHPNVDFLRDAYFIDSDHPLIPFVLAQMNDGKMRRNLYAKGIQNVYGAETTLEKRWLC